MADVFSDALHELWRNLRDGFAPHSLGYVLGFIDGLAVSGNLNAEQRELWKRRIETCPGHDDEGGRSWCAYCGNMPDKPIVDGPWTMNEAAERAAKGGPTNG